MLIVDNQKIKSDEIRIILKALEEKYGFGYSEIKEVGQLQAKLSILLEASVRNEEKILHAIFNGAEVV